MKNIWKKVGTAAFWIFWVVEWFFALWCTGALYFQRVVPPLWGKLILIALYLGATLFLMLWSLKKRWILAGIAGFSVCFAAAWLLFQHPTGARDWDPPFARVPVARFSADGKSVTIENIRDFHYRTEDDYDVRYRTESYCFDDLETMDYSITHWNGSESFGHIMLSFGFKDGRRIVISPEARMERGKKYEILPGFFRQYELIYIVATEEDAIQLRTHHRRYEKEEVLLYPTTTTPEVARFIFRDLLERSNRLAEHPEFYNGITYNCLSCMAPTAQKLGFDFCDTWRGVCNGFSDRYGFRVGWLYRDDPTESFADYRKRHSVNQYVEHLAAPPDYSKLIRPWCKQK